MKKVINKGYTLTVVSWENDGDHYATNSKTVETLEEAKVWWDMMQLCDSKNNQPNGIVKLGNSYDGFTPQQEEVAVDFIMKHHKTLLPDDNIEEDEDGLVYLFSDLAGELLGYSEYYACRVMESCSVTYSAEDIYLEEINF